MRVLSSGSLLEAATLALVETGPRRFPYVIDDEGRVSAVAARWPRRRRSTRRLVRRSCKTHSPRKSLLNPPPPLPIPGSAAPFPGLPPVCLLDHFLSDTCPMGETV